MPVPQNPQTPKKPPTGRNPNLDSPPDDSIWVRYSPNHEFPLSAFASVLSHLFVVLLVALFGSLIFNWSVEAEPPTLGNIVIAGGGGDGEGGGDPNAANERVEAVQVDPKKESVTSGLTLDLSQLSNDTLTRMAEQAKSERERALALQEQAKRAGEKGLGGSGTGGGKGTGEGAGIGSGKGPGVETARAKRMQRWLLNFRFDNGQAYLGQLENLQAILIIPEGNQFRVFHLKDGVGKGSLESAAYRDKIRSSYISWTDANRESLRALSKALRLASTPKEIEAYFPVELELALAKRELEHKGLTEDDIERQKLMTQFKAERVGKNWIVEVLRQEPLR